VDSNNYSRGVFYITDLGRSPRIRVFLGLATKLYSIRALLFVDFTEIELASFLVDSAGLRSDRRGRDPGGSF
jgi:hypothetical protein